MRNDREDRGGYQTSQSKHTMQNIVTIPGYTDAHAQRTERVKMVTEKKSFDSMKAGDCHFICRQIIVRCALQTV